MLSNEDCPEIVVVRAQLKAWERLDWQAAAAMFKPDGRFAMAMLDPVVGRESILAFLQSFSGNCTRMKIDILEIGIINGKVFAERVDRFDYGAHEIDLPCVGIFEIEDGLILEWREYFDRNSIVSPASA